ncbi:unnamed protein product [Lathyrus sativus]|nr:unnamed protein product [Lathyrus sativus]
MAATAIAGNGSAVSWMQFGRKEKKQNKMNRVRVCCSSSVTDPYKILRIQPDASESDVRKAFRQLALQYHPDICKGSDCGVQFHLINEAYDVAMANLREETRKSEECKKKKIYYDDEPLRGMHDPDWQYWEEWMGYEGAGITDWSSHINPFI